MDENLCQALNQREREFAAAAAAAKDWEYDDRGKIAAVWAFPGSSAMQTWGKPTGRKG